LKLSQRKKTLVCTITINPIQRTSCFHTQKKKNKFIFEKSETKQLLPAAAAILAAA